jgi:cysteine desulfurase
MKKPVYMDYAATTPVDPAVADEMMKYLTLDGVFGNPASRTHAYGWQAEAAVEAARKKVASLVHADPREIVWTSGATESDNLAIKGAVAGRQGAHIVTSRIEHKAVVDTCKWLEHQGTEVTWLEPAADGTIGFDQVLDALKENTVLVSLMLVNNELGTINDIAAIGAELRQRGILFHVDAAQAAGKMAIDVGSMPVDLLALSGHKVYGPKGVGALYVRRSPDVRIEAQIHGGGHERGMRSGTLPTHQIVGIGTAAQQVAEQLTEEVARIRALRDRLEQALLALGDVYLNGHPQQRVAGHLNLSFDGVDGEILLASLAQVAVSSGSACTSASVEPSYVLKALGRSNGLAHAGLRFSIGRYTTAEDIDFAIEQVSRVVTLLRQQTRRV